MIQDKITVTTTYYRDEYGECRIRTTVGNTVVSDEPNCYFFVDTDQMKPWFEVFGKDAVKQ